MSPASPRSLLPSRPSELALAAALVATVALLIVPLPTWLLDVLLAANLSLSIGLLVRVLHAPSAVSLSTFPTVLLLTTLFRVALNVSSSRLILLQADAGRVIRSFGDFAVRGNYLVGAIVFAVVTIVQLVVVTKGAERVAEVSARFTLDALPGKQLAIDADVRSGLLDARGAARARESLQRESQFFGAMDGAMKFVRGDALATLLIAGVNVLGGLAVGVGQQHMGASEALARYGLLAIGDGLVSQIPSLVIAVAAGVLVTRVAGTTASEGLAHDLSSQLFGAPRPLLVTAALLVVLALVPGLPAFPFAGLAVAVGALAARAIGRGPHRSPPADDAEVSAARFTPRVDAWAVDLAPDLDAALGAEAERAADRVRERVFQALGVPAGRPRVRRSSALPARGVRLSIREVPVASFTLERAPQRSDGDALTDALAARLESRAGELLGLKEVEGLVASLARSAPATVRQVTPKPHALPTVWRVLVDLVGERVSVRDLEAVFEALASAPASATSPSTLTAHVRRSLQRALTHAVTGGSGEAAVVVLDATLEETLRHALRSGDDAPALALPPAALREVRVALARAASQAGLAAVFLTDGAIRKAVRDLIALDLPGARVLGRDELTADTRVIPIATASLEGLG